jgi:hypothetical protein
MPHGCSSRECARYGLGFFANLILPGFNTFFLTLLTVPSSTSVLASGALEDDPKANVGVGTRLLPDGVRVGVGAVMVIGTAWLCCAERDKGGSVGRSPPLLGRRWCPCADELPMTELTREAKADGGAEGWIPVYA